MKHRTQIWTCPAFDAGTARHGKFLQLELDGKPWLLFASPDNFRYHNQILAGFLGERGIAHRWADRETLEYDGQRVGVRGGGRFRLRPDAATLELWDESTRFGRFDDARFLTALADAPRPWSGLTVRIRDDAARP